MSMYIYIFQNCVQQCLVKSAVTLGLDPTSQNFLHRNHHKHHRNHVHNHNNNNHHHDSNSSTPVTPVKTEYSVPSPPTTPNNFHHKVSSIKMYNFKIKIVIKYPQNISL